MVFVRFAVAVALATLLASSASAAPHVDPSVHRTLRQQGSVNLIVTFKQGTTAVLQSVHEAEHVSRGDKIKALVTSLEAHTEVSQAELTKMLSEESASFASSTAFWISNQRYFQGATLGLVEKLERLRSVSGIREQIVLPVPTTTTVAPSNTTAVFEAQPLAVEYGVAKVQADQVWAYGFTGQGIVVGSIGTGVLATHDTLKGNWRASYGWYDPSTKTATPTDVNGLGTHTMGTIAGVGGIGVAPGASWIACRGCTASSCSESDLLTCAQWVTCPTDATGKNKDCTKAPNVVSNAWGGGQGDTFYKAAVDAWQAAGIIPIFENGNGGPKCSTANSPGDYVNVIAVGATDSTDALASFSSKGPSIAGLVKPEVSAPGVSVRSAWNTGNSAFNSLSGVSMATPHVTGVVALLLSAKRSLKFADIKSLLTTTADTATLKASGYNCGTSEDGVFPNNMYGYGRVNALVAFQKATGVVVTPTTRPPIPVPTSAPTTKTPIPVPTISPPASAPTTRFPTPAPTTRRPTPAPTKNICTGLSYLECSFTLGCEFDYIIGTCVIEF